MREDFIVASLAELCQNSFNMQISEQQARMLFNTIADNQSDPIQQLQSILNIQNVDLFQQQFQAILNKFYDLNRDDAEQVAQLKSNCYTSPETVVPSTLYVETTRVKNGSAFVRYNLSLPSPSRLLNEKLNTAICCGNLLSFSQQSGFALFEFESVFAAKLFAATVKGEFVAPPELVAKYNEIESIQRPVQNVTVKPSLSVVNPDEKLQEQDSQLIICQHDFGVLRQYQNQNALRRYLFAPDHPIITKFAKSKIEGIYFNEQSPDSVVISFNFKEKKQFAALLRELQSLNDDHLTDFGSIEELDMNDTKFWPPPPKQDQ